MNTDTSIIHPITYKGGYFIKHAVSLDSIKVACEAMYLEYRFDPHFMALSQADHDIVCQETKALYFDPQHLESPEEVRILPKLAKLLNQTTGALVEVFISERIPQGTVLFGRFDL